MTFPEFVRACARNDDLVREFDRLRGTSFNTSASIDDALAFIRFARDLWDRLPDDQREVTHG